MAAVLLCLCALPAGAAEEEALSAEPMAASETEAAEPALFESADEPAQPPADGGDAVEAIEPEAVPPAESPEPAADTGEAPADASGSEADPALPDPADASGPADAEGEEELLIGEMEPFTSDVADLFPLDSEERFELYENSLLYGGSGGSPRLRARRNLGDQLTGTEAVIYAAFRAAFAQIAAGGQTSSVVAIPMSDFGQTTFTAEELGLPYIYRSKAWHPDLKDRLREIYSFNLQNILQAILNDFPYELYWFDKTIGIQAKAYTYSAREGKLEVSGSYTFYFAVSRAFSTGKTTDVTINGQARSFYLEVDTSVGARVRGAAANAKQIVADNASLSGAGKLAAYRRVICGLVEYDTAATAAGTPYGDPWQLIAVFDGDTATNVVCEGYAKAFKYLCDLSATGLDDIYCYSVTGTMNGGEHMWNIVTMEDGRNYLVDVTNCDTGKVGADDLLFLAGWASGTAGRSYVYAARGRTITYTYSDRILAAFDASTLAMSRYGYYDAIPGDVSGDRHVNATDVLRLMKYMNGQDVAVASGALDVNGDGRVSVADLLRLLRLANGDLNAL